MKHSLLLPLVALTLPTILACATTVEPSPPTPASPGPATVAAATNTPAPSPTIASPPALSPNPTPTRPPLPTRVPRNTAPTEPSPTAPPPQLSVIASLNPNLPRLLPDFEQCLQEQGITDAAIHQGLNLRDPDDPRTVMPKMVEQIYQCIDGTETETVRLLIARAAAIAHAGGDDRLTLIHWEPHTWPTGARGCDHDISRPQHPVPGNVAIFATTDATIQVHVGKDHHAFVPAHCQHPNPNYRQAGQSLRRAREAAMNHMGGAAHLTPIHWQPYTWPNGLKGCDYNGVATAAEVPGYVIIFATPDGDTVRVHVPDQGRAFVPVGCNRLSPEINLNTPDPAVPHSAIPEPHPDAAIERHLRNAATTALEDPSQPLTLVHWQDYTWSDSATGCPQDGYGYFQAEVSGYVALYLARDGSLIRVHQGHGIFLPEDCLRLRPNLDHVASALQTARETATHRLNEADADLILKLWMPYTWGNGGMGCTRQGHAYTEALVSGHVAIYAVIPELGATERIIRVHVADDGRAFVPIFCDRLSPDLQR